MIKMWDLKPFSFRNSRGRKYLIASLLFIYTRVRDNRGTNEVGMEVIVLLSSVSRRWNKEYCDNLAFRASFWAAAGFKDTELGVSMKPEVSHGATQVYARV